MFERFTERARQVIVLAQEEARTLRHNYIGTEHLLLGLLREADGWLRVCWVPSRSAWKKSGVSDRESWVRATTSLRADPLHTPRQEGAGAALREALSLGHNYIGTEHILLGLVRESEG